MEILHVAHMQGWRSCDQVWGCARQTATRMKCRCRRKFISGAQVKVSSPLARVVEGEGGRGYVGARLIRCPLSSSGPRP
jgi:hypothetical protein